MKFRSLLLVSTLTVLASAMISAGFAAYVALDRTARHDIAVDLTRSRQVFEEAQGYRQALYRASNQVVAEEPRLKAVTASVDVSRETLHGVAVEVRTTLGSELFLILDAKGQLLSDASNGRLNGFDFEHDPLVARAISGGDASGVWTAGGQAYQVQGQLLRFGTTPVGVLVTGWALGDEVAVSVFRQTATSLVIELDGRTVAASPFELGAPAVDELSAALRLIPTGGAAPVEVLVGADRYLAMAHVFPGVDASRPLRFVLLRSLDSALAPVRRLMWLLLAVLGAALVLATVVSASVSQRVASPVQQLVAFTSRVGEGKLDEQLTVRGPVELQQLAGAMNKMTVELKLGRERALGEARVRREMEIAARIQTSIVPKIPVAPQLELAGVMIPASEVGGDYYDVVPAPDGAWIGIGDVAGHGVPAGLVMLMIQSAISALCRQAPTEGPGPILARLNEVLYDNIRLRLLQDEHATLTLLRFFVDGRLVFAGAHEEILVWRAADKRVEVIATPGTWLGARKDVAPFMVETQVRLSDGDLVMLHTDGITEARSTSGEEFGPDRLRAALERVSGLAVTDGVASVRDQVCAFMAKQDDDLSLVLFRYRSKAY